MEQKLELIADPDEPFGSTIRWTGHELYLFLRKHSMYHQCSDFSFQFIIFPKKTTFFFKSITYLEFKLHLFYKFPFFYSIVTCNFILSPYHVASLIKVLFFLVRI